MRARSWASVLAAVMMAGVAGIGSGQPPVESIPELPEAPSVGPAEAPVRLVEVTRFGCSMCKDMRPILERLHRAFPRRLRIVQVPFASEWPAPGRATAAALAAGRQGQYEAMAELLFEHQPAFSGQQLRQYARQLGLDMVRFEHDMNDPTIAERIEFFNEVARGAHVTRTPTYFLAGRKLVGRQGYEELAGAVAKLAGVGKPDPPTGAEDLYAGPPTWDQMIYDPGEQAAVVTSSPLAPGDPAPDFELPAVEGEPVRLSAFRGRKIVVLSFVPAAFTPVCSRQWGRYVDHKDQFDRADAVVVGITTDNLPTLWAWSRGMRGLHFAVLSDFWPHGAVAKKYGILREDSGEAERALFVVDKSGTLRYVNVHDIHREPSLEELLEVVRTVDGGGPPPRD